MTSPIRIHFFTLTDTTASEHIYMSSLRDALTDRDVVAVDDWREADVVHLFEVNFYSRAALSEFEYLTLFRILRSDTPVVVSTDDLFFLGRPELTARPGLYPLNHRTQKWLFDNCDRIIAISESVKRALKEEFPESKIDTVHHGIDARYRADDNSSKNKNSFVLHVSLAAKRKNPAAIAEVAKRLDHQFVIAGSGWDEHIPDETENVDVKGYVPEDELVDLYKRAVVFYFPTFHEGFGLPILEAMAAGCAVVASDVYSVPEVTNYAAILCDPHDTNAHVKAIERLLEDKNERRALSTRALERAGEFSWEKAAKATMNIYRELT